MSTKMTSTNHPAPKNATASTDDPFYEACDACETELTNKTSHHCDKCSGNFCNQHIKDHQCRTYSLDKDSPRGFYGANSGGGR